MGGRQYQLPVLRGAVRPRLVDREQAMQAARPALNRVERITFRALGIRQFLLLQRAG